jgi:hypothetical protein
MDFHSSSSPPYTPVQSNMSLPTIKKVYISARSSINSYDLLHPRVVIVGQPGSGKSRAITSLLQTLRAVQVREVPLSFEREFHHALLQLKEQLLSQVGLSTQQQSPQGQLPTQWKLTKPSLNAAWEMELMFGVRHMYGMYQVWMALLPETDHEQRQHLWECEPQEWNDDCKITLSANILIRILSARIQTRQ